MAYGKKTGGRKKGTLNKSTVERMAELIAGGETPLEYMLSILRDDSQDFRRRDDMARGAAPYIHPRLAATEISGDQANPIQHHLKISFVKAGE